MQWWLVVLIGLCLPGCCTSPRGASLLPNLKINREYLEQLNCWQIGGSVSVQYHDRRELARFRWHQQLDHYEIELTGPLNFGKIRLVGTPRQIELWRAGNLVATAQNPEQLLQKTIGWSLPVAGMRYWLWGLPHPDHRVTQSTPISTNHLPTLSQDSWKISWQNFTLLEDPELPLQQTAISQYLRSGQNASNQAKKPRVNRVILPRTINLESSSTLIKIKITSRNQL